MKDTKKKTTEKTTEKAEKKKIIFVGDPDDQTEKPAVSINKKWTAIVVGLILIVCIGLFAIGSYAGLIQTFLTPESKRLAAVAETTEESTTPAPTTTVKPTTTKATTTEETTEEFVPSYYVINVNLAYNQVVVYTRGDKISDGYDPDSYEDDVYNMDPVCAFSCSPGIDGATPTGRFYLGDRSDWCLMIGDVYTQYATRITDAVMFHSIPYYTKDPGDIETYEYNILGYDASSGCIRLDVADASWIFFNCAEGTEVNIYYDWSTSSPIEVNPTYQIPTDIEQLSGWDPTDVYSAGNPWLTYNAYLTQESIYVPCGSSVDYMVACLGPTDEYGNNLYNYFYTAGGYDLWTPGTYSTTGYIDIGNLKFSFPITITVTEELSDDYYQNYYGDNSGDDSDDTYDYSYYDDYSEGSYDDNTDYSQYDAGGYYGEDSLYSNTDYYAYSDYSDSGYDE